MDVQRWLALLAAALAIPAIFACGGTHGAPQTTGVPAHTSALAVAALADARLDAARVAGIPPLDVQLVDIAPTTWDGCLGIAATGQACTQVAVPGIIARFEASGRTLRYHLAGARYLGPVETSAASPGAPDAATARGDQLEATLAYYARADLALRENVDPTDITVDASFPGACGPGRPLPNVSCAVAGYRANFRLVADGREWFYEVTSDIRTAKLTRLDTPSLADNALAALQGQMRADLAHRLHTDVTRVSILSYVRVNWHDACLGIDTPGEACAQVVTPGFNATLLASPAGTAAHTYTYRGSSSGFVAADFVPMATIDPLAP